MAHHAGNERRHLPRLLTTTARRHENQPRPIREPLTQPGRIHRVWIPERVLSHKDRHRPALNLANRAVTGEVHHIHTRAAEVNQPVAQLVQSPRFLDHHVREGTRTSRGGIENPLFLLFEPQDVRALRRGRHEQHSQRPVGRLTLTAGLRHHPHRRPHPPLVQRQRDAAQRQSLPRQTQQPTTLLLGAPVGLHLQHQAHRTPPEVTERAAGGLFKQDSQVGATSQRPRLTNRVQPWPRHHRHHYVFAVSDDRQLTVDEPHRGRLHTHNCTGLSTHPTNLKRPTNTRSNVHPSHLRPRVT